MKIPRENAIHGMLVGRVYTVTKHCSDVVPSPFHPDREGLLCPSIRFDLVPLQTPPVTDDSGPPDLRTAEAYEQQVYSKR